MNLEFDLHKLHLDELVLGARLAQTGFEEGKSRRIMIKDMSADAVKQLLKYIYSGEVDSDDESIYDLFIGAQKYDIPGLKEGCQGHLLEHLHVGNVTDSFRLASIFNCPHPPSEKRP